MKLSPYILLSRLPPNQKALQGQEGRETQDSCRMEGCWELFQGDFPSARTCLLPGAWYVMAQLESRKVRVQSSFIRFYTNIPPPPELFGSWVEMERAQRVPETEIRRERSRAVLMGWIPEFQIASRHRSYNEGIPALRWKKIPISIYSLSPKSESPHQRISALGHSATWWQDQSICL